MLLVGRLPSNFFGTGESSARFFTRTTPGRWLKSVGHLSFEFVEAAVHIFLAVASVLVSSLPSFSGRNLRGVEADQSRIPHPPPLLRREREAQELTSSVAVGAAGVEDGLVGDECCRELRHGR